jgi:hypothetical protein
VQPETKFVAVKFGESDKSYDYLLPADFDVSPGQRVMVPMRGREVSVQVVEVKDHSDVAKVAIARLDVRTDEQRAASIRTASTCGRRTARCWTRTATGRSSTTWTSRSPAMNDRPNLPALVAGASVSAIIPSNLEETWRLSTMIVEADLAPQALIGRAPAEDAGDEAWKRWGKKATSAVATVMMSGAELGLPPMVALRSFTVIGGRPALYGDGLINVVRRSGKCAYVRTGYDAAKKAGWCEAKRADGEDKRVEFTEQEARTAGLWDDRTTRRGKVWKNGKQEWGDVPNDSTWHRYPQRMLAWRAAGYCLRELFADVLGGIRDEFEAREIAGEVIEHVHEEPAPAKIAPPSPPKPPSPPSPTASNETEADPSEIVPETGEATEALMDDERGEDAPFDFGLFFENFQIALQGARSIADVEDVWNEFDVESVFEGDDDSRRLADQIKSRRLLALNPLAGG